jgi:hypothetical protein
MEVVVCTAIGGRITPGFLESWSVFLHWADQKETQEKYQFRWKPFGGSDVSMARNGCLRGATAGDPKLEGRILPWQGKIEYDKILWIDTDTVFDVPDVEKILSHDVDIVSGCVKVNLTEFGLQLFIETPYGGKGYSTIRDRVRNPDTDEMVDTFKLWVEENRQENGLCEVDVCGGAFMAVKKGVYESMEFPWYSTTFMPYDGEDNNKILCSEDIGWCVKATKLGYKIWADPEIRPGHEKALILR